MGCPMVEGPYLPGSGPERSRILEVTRPRAALARRGRVHSNPGAAAAAKVDDNIANDEPDFDVVGTDVQASARDGMAFPAWDMRP